MANGDTNENPWRHEVSPSLPKRTQNQDWFREFDRSQVPHVSVARLAWTLGFFAVTAIASIFAFVSLLAANSAFENQRDEGNNFRNLLNGSTPFGKWLKAEDAYGGARNILLLCIALLAIAVTMLFYDAYRAARCLSPGRPLRTWTNATIALFMWKRTEEIDQIACSRRVSGMSTQPAEPNFGLVLGRIWWVLNVGFWIFLIATVAVAGNNSGPSAGEVFPDPEAFFADMATGTIAFLIALSSCVVGSIYCGNIALKVSKGAMQQAWDDNRSALTTMVSTDKTNLQAGQSPPQSPDGVAEYQFSNPPEEIRQRLERNKREQEERIAALSPRDQVLFDDLIAWRSETARAADVPQFVVCNDHTIFEICTEKPKTITELRQVQGMGDIKVAKFGEAILSIIND
jgi:hypothetical protein